MPGRDIRDLEQLAARLYEAVPKLPGTVEVVDIDAARVARRAMIRGGYNPDSFPVLGFLQDFVRYYQFAKRMMDAERTPENPAEK